MYAIIQDRGRQYRVEAGQTINVDLMEAEPGSTIELGQVLLVGGDDGVRIGTPVVPGARVRAEVHGEQKGEKIIVFRYRNKTRYRRRTGHRQRYTSVTIKEIVAGQRDEQK